MSEGKDKIFLIGAARSGTKIVRDLLASAQDICAVPYDINFIWRWGNESFEHDELVDDHVNSKIHKKIDSYLNSFKKSDCQFLIEKTVSNTIRIPFLLKHYPQARFIYLYRDGMDVTESVMRQWKAKPDRKYLIEKARTIPFEILMNYGRKFLIRNLKRQKNDFFWGVNYPGLMDSIANDEFEEVIAKQWKYSVDKMNLDKKAIPSKNIIEINYEDLIGDTRNEVDRVGAFLSIHDLSDKVNLKMIKKGNIGKSRKSLTPEQISRIEQIIND